MDGRPRLPARRRRELDAVRQGPLDLQQLQQQLIGNDTFRQLLDQPHKVAAVLQADPVLQQAAADSPEIAQLLDPATMQQALEVLMQPQQQHGSNGTLPIQRKALMQLQNYALQMQQARAAECGVGIQQDTAPQLHVASAALPSSSVQQQQQQPVKATSQEAMWAALQQRLNKYQERTQVLASGQQGLQAMMQQQQQQRSSALLGAPSHACIQQQHQQHSMLAGHVTPTPAPTTGQTLPPPAAAAAVPHSEPSAFDVSQTMQELLMAFPDVLMSAGPTNGSHATIGLLSAVAEQPPLEVAAAAEADSSGVGSVTLSSLQVQLQPSEPCALPFSPTWRQEQQQQQQQQQHQSAGSLLWPLSISDPAVNAADVVAAGSSSAVSRVSEGSSWPSSTIRSASALGHRILRPHSSSPIPLGSGSTPLGMEQLGSGEVIVDITPPTKVTKDLSWSVDPDADYVLDASASGSFSPLPLSALAASAALYGSGPGSLAAASWGASLDSLAAFAGSSNVGRMVHSSSGGNYHDGLHSSCDGPLCPLPEDSGAGIAAEVSPPGAAAAALAAAAAGMLASGQTPAAAAIGAPRLSSSSSAGSGGFAGKAKTERTRLKPHSSVAAAAAAAASGRSIGASHAAAHTSSATACQQQHVLPVSTRSSSTASTATAAGTAHTGFQGTSYCNSSAVLASRTTQPSGAGFGGKALNPRSYYEDVTPSNWRPRDMGDVHGDYLDLYRRAYCSYADALFPPLWLSLMCILVSSHVLPMWQVLLLGAVTFWGGLYVMAVQWAGVPTGQLSLSRATPMTVVSLEVLCVGSFVCYVLPVMWLGQSVNCVMTLTAAAAMLGLHFAAHVQDPGYTPKALDPEEGPYARRLSAPDDTQTTGPAAAAVHTISSSRSTGKLAAECQQQRQRAQQQPAPKLAGKALNSCWTCGVERNLRSKHCPMCKRCVERFDHHCPVIGNCVGAGNHRSFVGYLVAMVLCQLLFCHLLSGMFIQQHGLQLLRAELVARPAAAAKAATFDATAGTHTETDTQRGDALAGQALVNSGQMSTGSQIAGQTWVPGVIELGKPVVAIPGAHSIAVIDAAIPAAAAGALEAADTGAQASGNTATGPVAINAANAVVTAAAGAGRHLADIALNASQAAAAVVNTVGATATGGGDSSSIGGPAAVDTAAIATSADFDSLSDSLVGPVVRHEGVMGSSGSSRAAELEQLLHRGAGWGWQGWQVTIKALWAAAGCSPGLLVLLLLQFPALFISCTLLLRALALAAANLTVNEWTNRHRYLHLQHQAAGFCNRFDRGPAQNCWEFWFGPTLTDWWAAWQQGEDELQLHHTTVLVRHSATSIIRWWDIRWATYQRKLLAARERRKGVAMRRKMDALGLKWDGQGSD